MSEFATAVRAVVRGIPHGATRTYREVALAAGYPCAARAVANVLARNYDPEVPCHRVIRSDGTIGGYNRGGSAAKAQRLQREGVILVAGGAARVPSAQAALPPD